MSDVLTEMKRLADRLPPPPPARRLEVGPGVVALLKACAPPPAGWLLSPAARLTGIPIVEAAGMEPGGWRMVEDGAVVAEGSL